MTTQEFKELERLFSKLSTELGGYPICILNGQHHDFWHIGVYDKKVIKDVNGKKEYDGMELGRNTMGIDLESTTKKLNEKFEPDFL